MSSSVELLGRIGRADANVAVLGQGYVGLTLACAVAEAGHTVTGIDVDAERVRALGERPDAVPGVDPATVTHAIATGRLRFTTDVAAVADAQIVAICVPTPLLDGAPDLRFVERAARDAAACLRPGTLVILESTTYPGTTETVVRPILESGGLRSGIDFLLAYSPERVDPGNREHGMRSTPRLVGGDTPQAATAAASFYGAFVDKVLPVSSTGVAETAKLLENTFRHVNIALINEFAELAHELGIDLWEVIDAAATKPFGFMPFYPGPGVGGHCIPLDPTYLSWEVRRRTGRRFGVLEAAQDVNDRMPTYVATRVAEILNDVGRPVRSSRILVLGVTYKADVGDVRESPGLAVLTALQQRGAEVSYHDPFVPAVFLSFGELHAEPDLDGALERADLVVLVTPHPSYDLDDIAERSRVVFDTRNAYRGVGPENVIPL